MTASPLSAGRRETARPEEPVPDAPTGGFRTFLVVWFGQMVSTLGSGLTGFALGVWVYQTTGSTTHFALLTFFNVLPAVFLAPVAGVLVDRWDRRWALMLSDCGAAVPAAGLLWLTAGGNLEIWHTYVAVAIGSAFNAFQMPAFLASVPLLVDKAHLGRTAGLTQLGQALPRVGAPLLAGAVIAVIGLEGILVADLATFVVAVVTLLVVRIPRPPAATEEEGDEGGLLRRALFGWTYLRRRPGLLVLLGLFACINFGLGTLQALLTPLVLSFTTARVLGVVMGVASVGLVVGSVLMSVWGGPQRRVPHGILLPLVAQGAILFLAGLEPSALLVGVAAFAYLFFMPIINGNATAIFQAKVEPSLQGRVFAFQRLLAWSMLPPAFLLSGPLADRVFEPLMAPDGALAGTVGRVIGTGTGRGIALMFILLAFIQLTVTALAARQRRLRHLEEELPDRVGGDGVADGETTDDSKHDTEITQPRRDD